jgi:hypothetical protein
MRTLQSKKLINYWSLIPVRGIEIVLLHLPVLEQVWGLLGICLMGTRFCVLLEVISLITCGNIVLTDVV